MSTFFKKYNVIKKFCGFNHKTFLLIIKRQQFLPNHYKYGKIR